MMAQNKSQLTSFLTFRRRIENKFIWLLVPLASLIFLPSFVSNDRFKDAMIYGCLILVFLAGVFLLSKTVKLFYKTSTLAGLALLLNAISFPLDTQIIFLLRMVALMLFLGWLLYYVLMSMAKARRISEDIIYGAINGYLLLGILGGFGFRMIYFFYPDAFAMSEMLGGKLDIFVYFSFVTLTNLGYGDVTPIQPPSQSMALFLAILGQMYLAVVIGILVGKFILFRKK